MRDIDREAGTGDRLLTRAALLTAQVGQALTFVMLPAVLPQIAAYFGGGPAGELVAQQMAVAPFLGLTLGGLFSGTAIRLAGARRTALGAALLYALAGAVPLVATAAMPMLAASLLLGLGASLLTSAISVLSAEVRSGDRLARLVSHQVAIAILSGVVIGFLAALAAQSFGWRAPFAGYALTGATIFALGWLGLPRVQACSADGSGAGGVIRQNAAVYVLAFLFFVVVTLQPTYLPFLMAEHGIASAPARAALLTLSTFGSFLGSLAYPQLAARLAPGALRGAPVVLLATAFALFATWQGSAATMGLAMALGGLGTGLIIPALFATALERAPHAGGQAVGLLNVAIFGGSFLTPYLLAPLRAMLGIQPMMWAILAAILLTGAAVLSRRVPERPRTG